METNNNSTLGNKDISRPLVTDGMLIPVGGTVVLENLIALVILYQCKRLNFQVKILSVNLVISDISMGIFVCFPLSVYEYGNNCEFKKYAAFLCINVSLFTVTMYNLDRCLVFVLGMKYYKYVKENRLTFLCVILWVMGGITTFLIFYSENDPYKIGCFYMFELKKNNVSQTTKILLLSIILSNGIMYIFLLHHIRKITRRTGDISSTFPGITNGQSRIAKKVSVITVTFLVIATPYYVIITFPILDYSSAFGNTVHSLCAILLFLNSAINPVLYIWRMSEPRYHLKLLIMFWSRTYCEKLKQEYRLECAPYNMTNLSPPQRRSSIK